MSSTDHTKRQRSTGTPSLSAAGGGSVRLRKRQKNSRTHRANESPLTFIRSSPPPSISVNHPIVGGSSSSSSVSTRMWSSSTSSSSPPIVEYIRRKFEHAMFFAEESVACLNSDSGTHFRNAVYDLQPMFEYEQFDTMAVRKIRNFFQAVVPGGETHGTLEFLTSEEETGGASDEPSSSPRTSPAPLVAIPRMDPNCYSDRWYVLFLRDAQEPIARIAIEHTIDELLERCPFLRDPSSTWISRPDRLHVSLAFTTDSNVSREEKNCKYVIENSDQMELRLHKFMWRRQGTLWAQWHCVRGNIDRLRSDLRIASRGSNVFTDTPEDDPTSSRPFGIETLIMSVLFKPTKDEFTQIQLVTDEMQRMFSGVVARIDRVHRISQLHDRIDKESVNGVDEYFDLVKTQLQNRPIDESFVDKLARGIHLLNTSPSVFRLALVWSAAGVCIAAGSFYYLVKRRSS